jgi:hypothetical protein
MKTNALKPSSTGVLWVTAIALGAILASMALRRDDSWGALGFFESTARGGLVSQVGGVTMMTVDGGSDDVLVVLDGRHESVLVYRVENATTVQLLQRLSLPQLFSDAKVKALGRN